MLNRKNLTLIVLILIALISVRFFPGCGEGLNLLTNVPSDRSGSSGVDWTLYNYKRMVTIQENSGAALSGYQVKLALTNANFSFANADSSGNDLRFSYNGTSLNYWIEDWDNIGETANVWINVPSIPSSGQTILYMYYGKAGETAVSGFSSTFTKTFDTANLVARWHMDEGIGASVEDSSADTNDGTITGASWAGSDGAGWFDRSDVSFSAGNSLSFDGSGDYVAVPDDSTLDANVITIEAWIRTGNNVTLPQYIIAKWDEGPEQRSYAISVESSTVYFLTSLSGTAATSDSMGRGAVAANTWYHIAVSSDGTNKKIYINGTQAGGNGAWANSIFQGTSVLTIGARDTSPANLFTGIIDEVYIYNRALTAAEIEYHSRRSKYVTPPPAYTIGGELLN